MCGDGNTEREIGRIAQPGANAWRAVEGVMADRRISKRPKGQGREHLCDTGTPVRAETLALTELQQQTLQVCENGYEK